MGRVPHDLMKKGSCCCQGRPLLDWPETRQLEAEAIALQRQGPHGRNNLFAQPPVAIICVDPAPHALASCFILPGVCEPSCLFTSPAYFHVELLSSRAGHLKTARIREQILEPSVVTHGRDAAKGSYNPGLEIR